ncbi:MAG TPA: CHASE2 domain-containing protein [Gammaproteobacteria bacterium]|nr:CHASE2 domain-containing protein [Gammaproteobacteria bacterium]
MTLVILVFANSGLLHSLESLGYDLGVQFSSSKPANQDVVVVAIDDAALEARGAWPWPRDLLAQAIDQLSAAHPSVIGMTLPLDTVQTYQGLAELQKINEMVSLPSARVSKLIKRKLQQLERSMDTDRTLAHSMSRAGRVVLAIPYLQDTRGESVKQTDLPEYLKKYTLRDVAMPKRSALMRWLHPELALVAGKVYPPIEPLARYAGGAGVINFGGYGQNVARSLPLVYRYGDSYLPSFALMMTARNMRLSTRNIQVDLGHSLELGDKLVSTDDKLQIYPRFYKGKDSKPAFQTYSILDLLNNKIKRSSLNHKTVLIGLTATQYVNPLMTPIGEYMPPVMVAAHAVSSMLNDELFKVPASRGWLQFAAFVIVGLYLMFVLPRFRLGTGSIMSLLFVVLLLNVFFYSMISKSTWLPLMAPLFALLLGHLVLGIKHAIEGRLKRIHDELSDANQALGQFLHQQGQLDAAFEKYRSCILDKSLLSKLYNLGLDYERKRQFNKAVTVFRYIDDCEPGYNDVHERLNCNQQVSNQILGNGGSMAANNVDATMMISSQGVEKPMLGRYKVDRELGRGAMGMVYLGHDPKIGRTVAIKTMSLGQEFEADRLDDVKKRFFREAETAGRMNHPNIVTIYDVGEDQELSYIAMDYLKGCNLLEYSKADKLLPAAEVFAIMIEVAGALEYAHGQRVVHRDIKPANLIYHREEKHITVTDFGVACLTDASRTRTGTILGSPSYMSPEQLAGKKVDGRSDLFSLGVTFYQMLTGELPFVADSLASLMYKITNEKHPDIRMFKPDLPSCVSQIINKALHKDIERRFQTGSQFAKALIRCRDRMNVKNKKKATMESSSDK